MKLYDNFKWPMPKGFRDALSKSLFERGDIIYDHKAAYTEDWGKSIQKIRYSIQLIKPEKVKGRTIEKKGDSVFSNNWKSPIEVTLTDYKLNKKSKIISFQGNLFKTIWKGSLVNLESESLAEIPLGFTFINKSLEKIRFPLGEGLFFLFAVDVTSTLHSQKTNNLKKAFDRYGTMHSLPYSELCLLSKNELLPTTQLNYIKINCTREKAVTLIKETLYSQSENKSVSERKFRIRGHGLMIEN